MSLIQACCPTCGQATGNLDLEALIARNSIRYQGASLLRILSKHKGRPIRSDRLVSALYEDDPSGGPDDAINALHVQIHRLRKKIAAEPIAIQAHGHDGYALVLSEGAR